MYSVMVTTKVEESDTRRLLQARETSGVVGKGRRGKEKKETKDEEEN